jgi:glycosyltransferase involved in cell wall biosynthesis
MPKILLVTTSFEPGAIPNILLDLAPIWVEEGFVPHIVTLEAFPSDDTPVRRWRALGLGIDALGMSSRATLGVLGPLKEAIRTIRPDLIHTHLGRADVYVPWVKGLVPQVTTFHSVRRNAGRLTRWGWKLSDRLVAHRTGVSQACLDSFYQDRFLRSAHSVIYNPVSPGRLESRRGRADLLESFGWDDPVRVLLAVGRLVPVKGQMDLLEAFGTLTKTRPDLRLVIAGDGPLERELRHRIGILGLETRVRLAGAWSGVGDLYRLADLLVFPSHWEGLGLVPLEALACGCPVVSSRLPAVEEFLTEGETGRFFAPGNPVDLARVVAHALDDPGASRLQAVRGGALVREKFAPALIAAQYGELWNRVLEQARMVRR